MEILDDTLIYTNASGIRVLARDHAYIFYVTANARFFGGGNDPGWVTIWSEHMDLYCTCTTYLGVRGKDPLPTRVAG